MADSNNLNWERISKLYSLALEMPADQWQSWLQTQCNEQEKKSGLDTYLLKLLKSSPRADAFFDALNQNIEEDFFRHKDMDVYKPGDTFDKFRIIKEIGHGGMSKVFLCQRDDGQFDQTVAIKVMKVRGDAEFMKDRFRQEQQILAGINHAHIAQLYDGGITEQGHPYIIMEYVEGEAIDIYCKRKNLGTKDKIRLFIQVCDALQYAHSRLIVHHDIKPANIMVNNQGKIKLLDFGISQVLFSQEKAEDRKTSFEGTLQYASPEQFEGAGPSVASDVYKLGLVLYNLLTGKLYNFNRREQYFRNELFENQLEGTGSAGKSRHSKNSLLLSDLDAILRKCLAKQPSQRFESVSALSHDLQNTLSNHALHSHPADLGYSLRKSYARNKAKVWMFTLFNLALIVSLVFLISQFRQTLQEKERSEHILEFVWDIFESADPEMAMGDTLTVYELLENSLPRIEALDKQPELQAELYYVTGNVYYNMGFWQRSNEIHYKALEINQSLPDKKEHKLEQARLYFKIASSHFTLAEYQHADSIIELSLKIYEKYDQTEHLIETGKAMSTKAVILYRMGRLEESLDYSLSALEFFKENSDDDFFLQETINNNPKIAIKNNITNILRSMARYDEALDYSLRAKKMVDMLVPDINSQKTTVYGDYALLLTAMERFEDALEVNHQLYKLCLKTYGERHPFTLLKQTNMAGVFYHMRDYLRADSLNLMLLEIYLEIFGPYHHYTLITINNLGNSLAQQGKFDEAIKYMKMNLEAQITTYGDSHHYVASTLHSIGVVYFILGEHSKSMDMLYQSVELFYLNFGEHSYEVSMAYRHIAEVYCRMGEFETCRDYFEKALEIAKEVLGNEHSFTANIKNAIAQYQSRF